MPHKGYYKTHGFQSDEQRRAVMAAVKQAVRGLKTGKGPLYPAFAEWRAARQELEAAGRVKPPGKGYPHAFATDLALEAKTTPPTGSLPYPDYKNWWKRDIRRRDELDIDWPGITEKLHQEGYLTAAQAVKANKELAEKQEIAKEQAEAQLKVAQTVTELKEPIKIHIATPTELKQATKQLKTFGAVLKETEKKLAKKLDKATVAVEVIAIKDEIHNIVTNMQGAKPKTPGYAPHHQVSGTKKIIAISQDAIRAAKQAGATATSVQKAEDAVAKLEALLEPAGVDSIPGHYMAYTFPDKESATEVGLQFDALANAVHSVGYSMLTGGKLGMMRVNTKLADSFALKAHEGIYSYIAKYKGSEPQLLDVPGPVVIGKRSFGSWTNKIELKMGAHATKIYLCPEYSAGYGDDEMTPTGEDTGRREILLHFEEYGGGKNRIIGVKNALAAHGWQLKETAGSIYGPDGLTLVGHTTFDKPEQMKALMIFMCGTKDADFAASPEGTTAALSQIYKNAQKIAKKPGAISRKDQVANLAGPLAKKLGFPGAWTASGVAGHTIQSYYPEAYKGAW